MPSGSETQARRTRSLRAWRSSSFILLMAAAAALLLYEHSLVDANDLSRLDAAFFTMNGMISITFFFFVLLDRLARGTGGIRLLG